MKVKNNAWLAVITPAGISRCAVLGLIRSYRLSIYLLNAIAALREVTIEANTSNSFRNISCCENGLVMASPSKKCMSFNPRKKPIKANGNAKMVWENFT